LFSLSFFRNSTAMVSRQPFDVINSHGVFCPMGGVHVAHSVHRAWLERSRQMYPALGARRLRQFANPQHRVILLQERRHFVRGYRAIIAVSRQVAEDLHRLYNTPASDIQVINNGFNPTEFNPQRRRERRAIERKRHGLADDEVVMLMVANELERKGLPPLLDAMQRLNHPKLKLLVAGRADTRPYLAGIAARNLQDKVVFTGPSSDVSALHAAADLFVLPTQYEAFCLAILEALGSGLPVITSDVPGAGDTIQPGINGLLLNNPRDAAELAQRIEQMLDPMERSRMDELVAPSVEDYQWERILDRYEQVLQANTH
jgi:UDP-glucose:(heptosyl)LPS alpha-1,3-glucosyltransferase